MAYYIPACLYYIVSFTNFAGDSYLLVDWVGEDSYSVVKGQRVNGLYRVGEVCRVKFGVGRYDGFIVAAGKSETCYSTTERTHIHGYMDLQALKMRWK